MILAGDVGGTKTHLALYEADTPVKSPVRDRKLPSQEAHSLEELVDRMLDGVSGRLSRAVFGIAGPVVGNDSRTTNLPWNASGAALSKHLGGADVTLLNDLVATAHGLAALEPGDLETLSAGTSEDGNRALIAAGTGLGEAVIVREGERWVPSASEGGHSDFAPQDRLQEGFAHWLREHYGHASNERVLSGNGLADLYRYFSSMDLGSEPDGFAETFVAAADPAAVVTAAALDRTCERAVMVVQTFLWMYGAEAGNVALRSLAVGGLFIGGGIAPRLRAFFQEDHFMQGFLAKGRARRLLERIPVKLILDPQTALWGAALLALDDSRLRASHGG